MSTTRPVLIRFYVERSKLPWDVNYFKGHDGHNPRKDPHLGLIQNHHGKFDLPVFGTDRHYITGQDQDVVTHFTETLSNGKWLWWRLCYSTVCCIDTDVWCTSSFQSESLQQESHPRIKVGFPMKPLKCPCSNSCFKLISVMKMLIGCFMGFT